MPTSSSPVPEQDDANDSSDFMNNIHDMLESTDHSISIQLNDTLTEIQHNIIHEKNKVAVPIPEPIQFDDSYLIDPPTYDPNSIPHEPIPHYPTQEPEVSSPPDPATSPLSADSVLEDLPTPSPPTKKSTISRSVVFQDPNEASKTSSITDLLKSIKDQTDSAINHVQASLESLKTSHPPEKVADATEKLKKVKNLQDELKAQEDKLSDLFDQKGNIR